MSEKLSDWFPKGSRPELVGVYETDAPVSYQAYQHWDGKHWGGYSHSVDEAKVDSDFMSSYQSPRWRGLAENPEA